MSDNKNNEKCKEVKKGKSRGLLSYTAQVPTLVSSFMSWRTHKDIPSIAHACLR